MVYVLCFYVFGAAVKTYPWYEPIGAIFAIYLFWPIQGAMSLLMLHLILEKCITKTIGYISFINTSILIIILIFVKSDAAFLSIAEFGATVQPAFIILTIYYYIKQIIAKPTVI